MNLTLLTKPIRTCLLSRTSSFGLPSWKNALEEVGVRCVDQTAYRSDTYIKRVYGIAEVSQSMSHCFSRFVIVVLIYVIKKTLIHESHLTDRGCRRPGRE